MQLDGYTAAMVVVRNSLTPPLTVDYIPSPHSRSTQPGCQAHELSLEGCGPVQLGESSRVHDDLPL
jgi:hypothetical protein